MTRVRAALAAAVALFAVGGCHQVERGPALTAEQAVQHHIAAAKDGDVAALRRLACGRLAGAMDTHTDAEIRREFDHAYDAGPDQLTNHPDSATRATVHGFYAHAADLDIAFRTEESGGWRVCEIRRGNGPFGRLSEPFEPAG